MGKRSLVFAVKTSGGQEGNVAKLIATRAKLKGLRVYSIIISPKMRGYVLLETDGVETANAAAYGIKNVRSIIPGIMTVDDIGHLIEKKPEVIEIKAGDLVEVVSGPFKGMKARVIRASEEKREAVISLIDVPYRLQVTVDASYLKKVEGSK